MGRMKKGKGGNESKGGERGEERRGGEKEGEGRGGGKREKTQYHADEMNRKYRPCTVHCGVNKLKIAFTLNYRCTYVYTQTRTRTHTHTHTFTSESLET